MAAAAELPVRCFVRNFSVRHLCSDRRLDEQQAPATSPATFTLADFSTLIHDDWIYLYGILCRLVLEGSRHYYGNSLLCSKFFYSRYCIILLNLNHFPHTLTSSKYISIKSLILRVNPVSILLHPFCSYRRHLLESDQKLL